MPSARKRPAGELEAESAQAPEEPSLLHRIRNMWQFANLCQWIALFGKAVRLDDELDIADLEAECLKPHSMALQDIGLSLLKFLSSHRGLTHELFEDYTRRQFIAKAPEKNPFGTDEIPQKFADFDVFRKLRVLQEMTQLVMMNPDRLREKTEEQKDMDQTSWRIEPYGWDRKDRTYFVLDDNRVYRLTDATPPTLLPAKSKKNTQKARAALRASKRRRISAALASDDEDAGDERSDNGQPPTALPEPEDDGLGGMIWECVAVTLDDVNDLLAAMDKKGADANEKVLRNQLREHLLPILEKYAESRKRKELQREKELVNLERMAFAKRSSRIANKAEQQRIDEQTRIDEMQRRDEERAARKADQKRLQMERDRDNRLMSRANRLKERESRRLQHEEELAQLSEDSKNLGAAPGRMSERRLQAEIEKNRQALKEIDEEEDDWIFDCVCGVYGQIDDGTHSVACEKCNVWQHSKCLGINEGEAEQDDFHFVCNPCRRRDQAEKEQRPTIIKIKVNRPGLASSSPAPNDSSPPQQIQGSNITVELPSKSASNIGQVPQHGVISQPQTARGVNINSHKPSGDVLNHPGQQTASLRSAMVPMPGVLPGFSVVQPPANSPGSNPFSSPHPTLSPPDQSPNKSRAYHTIHEQSSPLAASSQMSKNLKVDHQSSLSGTYLTPAASTSMATPKQAVTSASTSNTSHHIPLYSTVPGNVPASTNRNGIPSASGAEAALQLTPDHHAALPSQVSTPLLPSRGGLSPTKHSPPLSQKPFGNAKATTNGMSASIAMSPRPAILPPASTLSPSPSQQILTPPVKLAEPARSTVIKPQAAAFSPSASQQMMAPPVELVESARPPATKAHDPQHYQPSTSSGQADEPGPRGQD